MGWRTMAAGSASATAKHASCSRCAKRRPDIPFRDHPLPSRSSQPLDRSLCDHITQPRLADGEAGQIPCVGFYGDRICGTNSAESGALARVTARGIERQFPAAPGCRKTRMPTRTRSRGQFAGKFASTSGSRLRLCSNSPLSGAEKVCPGAISYRAARPVCGPTSVGLLGHWLEP